VSVQGVDLQKFKFQGFLALKTWNFGTDLQNLESSGLPELGVFDQPVAMTVNALCEQSLYLANRLPLVPGKKKHPRTG
jgi:hypothetical protein